MTKKYDLHVHSIYSDGTETPESLILQAKELGLSGISITDHDTINCYNDKLFSFANENDIKLIAGVELSSTFNGESFHILGYMVDVNSKSLIDFCLMHKFRRINRNLNILELLKKANMPIDSKKLCLDLEKSIGRLHIAKIMVESGYVKSTQEAFDKWIGDGKPCYFKGDEISVSKTIDVIHQAKGKAFLAHPILIKKHSMLRELVNFPFDGLECFYAKFSHSTSKRILEIAKKHNFIMSGGSDYHGSNVEYRKMGDSYTDEDNLNKIWN